MDSQPRPLVRYPHSRAPGRSLMTACKVCAILRCLSHTTNIPPQSSSPLRLASTRVRTCFSWPPHTSRGWGPRQRPCCEMSPRPSSSHAGRSTQCSGKPAGRSTRPCRAHAPLGSGRGAVAVTASGGECEDGRSERCPAVQPHELTITYFNACVL
jgi:hypothetical protein